jgi:hypothetical protein
MDDEFAHLYNRSLTSFAREVVGRSEWDTIDVGANGGISLYHHRRDSLRIWGNGGRPSDSPDEPPPARALVDVIAAIRAGRVRLLADSDRTMGFAEVVVPLGLLRGRWRVRITPDGVEWVRSINPSGREVVEPTYLRPRFVPVEQPTQSAPFTTTERPAYGKTESVLEIAMTTYKTEMADLKTQAARAKFLAARVNCSEGSAVKFLSDRARD